MPLCPSPTRMTMFNLFFVDNFDPIKGVISKCLNYIQLLPNKFGYKPYQESTLLIMHGILG
jgi:hypothetical protein